MEKKKSGGAARRIFFAAAAIFVVLALVAGTLAVALSRPSVQRIWLERALRERGIEAEFGKLSFGVLFSDEISARDASLKFPDGRRARLKKFFARHGGAGGLFEGEPSFRDFSCEGFVLEDADGARLLDFSCSADEIGASFPPVETLAQCARGEAFPFLVHAKNLRVKSPRGREIAVGDADVRFAGAEPSEFSGTIRGNFAELLAQPLFSKINNVAAGTFELTGRGCSARLALRDLRSRRGNIDVRAANFSVSRGEGASGKLSAEILGEDRSSFDVDFSRIEFGGGRVDFSGEMNADTLVVADIFRAGMLFRGWRASPSAVPAKKSAQAKTAVPAEKKLPERSVAAAEKPRSDEKKSVAGTPASSQQPPSASRRTPSSSVSRERAEEPPARAFWHGVSGKMSFRVKRVVFPSNETGTHEGAFSVSDDSVCLDYRVPEFFRGSAGGKIALKFVPAAPRYRLAGTLTARDVEIHNAVPALRSRDPAPIEGRFDLATEFSAAANEPERLEDTLTARFSMESAGRGRVRIFNAKSKKVRLAGDVLRIGGELANMLGGLTRNLEPRAARLARAVGLVKERLTDFSYRKMSVEGEYRAAGDILCRKAEMLGEDLRLFGTGRIRPIAGAPPENWQINAVAGASARGDAAAALGELGLLRADAGTPDADGFVPARSFEFSGTPADASSRFFETLTNAASGKKADFGPEPAVPAESLLDALM